MAHSPNARVLRASTRRDAPWRNGGGSTQEIARRDGGGDAGADPDFDFDWRISMARVEQPGDFSAFPGVTRTILVMSGGELDLLVDGIPTSVRVGGEPFSFDGGAVTSARLPGHPLTDLNVMVRDGRYSARVSLIEPGSVAAAVALPVAATLVLVAPESGVFVSVSRGGAVLISGDLEAFDAVLVEGSPAAAAVTVEVGASPASASASALIILEPNSISP